MKNSIEGFSVVECFHRRYWSGMVADLWSVDCAPRAGGHYLGNDPRLFIVLDSRSDEHAGMESDFKMGEVGGTSIRHCHRRAVSFIPAGMEMCTEISGIGHLRHLDLHFDKDALVRRLGQDVDYEALKEPRLLLTDPTLIALADLIAAECQSGEPLHDLYGDSLTLALVIGVLKLPAMTGRRRSQLANWQLRRAVDFIEANCLRTIRLEELGELTGLSQSYFSHAFKASTGVAPHQWQTKARIEQVKRVLAETDTPLTIIAAETGFADAAHFSRIFRREVGMAPSAWRRAHHVPGRATV